MIPEAEGIRILCIDGGGIKGYTALLILRRILRTISAETGETQLPKPCDVFNLIAGTSTGGIIAVMLGRLQMTIDECIEVYENLGKDVFGRPVGGNLGRVIRGMTNSPFYDINNLQEVIRSVIRMRGMREDEPFIEQRDPKCKVVLCVTRVETGKADVLRNYNSSHPTAENYDCQIWEAASATAAAPMYFKHVKFGSTGERWCDGALRRNNPINEALAEFFREPEWQNKSIGCLVSLGTGLARQRSISSNLASFLKGSVKMLTDAEDIARVFSASALGREMTYNSQYFRFNVPHGMEDLQLDEWKSTERMRAMTTEYLGHPDNGDAILRCAKSLLYPDENIQKGLKTKVSLTPHFPCTHFIRRTPYHDKLLAFFSPHMKRSQIFALWGLGGIGKTQIALDFAQTMKSRLSVFWIRADSLANFAADYSRLLGLIDPEVDQKPPQHLASLLESTRDKLEETAGEWLLILDNADHLDDFIGTSHTNELSISKYVPRRGRILITTRDRRFQGSVAAASDGIYVEPMTTTEARDLLLKSVPQHLVEPNSANILMASDLVDELGYLPLAIAQAAANIVNQQMSFAEYVGLFRRQKKRRRELMSSPAYDFANKDPRNEVSSVAVTWDISMDVLRHQSPLSVTFLQYLACFHWREVPRILLRRLPEFSDLDDVAFLQLTKKPLALSLIDQTLDDDPQVSVYSVHPVLHEIMTAALSREEKQGIMDNLIPLMSGLFPIVPDHSADNWPLAALLAPHLTLQIDLCRQIDLKSQAIAILMFSLSRFQHASRMNMAAADLAEASLSMACKTIIPPDDKTLIPHLRLHAIQRLNDAGQYKAAEKECTTALQLLESDSQTGKDIKTYNAEKVFLLSLLSVSLRGSKKYDRLIEIHQIQIRSLGSSKDGWSAEDVLHRHNHAYGLLRNGQHEAAKELNDHLLHYCESTQEGMNVVGKKLYLIMLNLRVLIMRMSPNESDHLDDIINIYDHVFIETLSECGIHDKDTWIALNNRIGSLNQAMRMDEIGELLWAVLPLAIAAGIKADGSITTPMMEISQVAYLYLKELEGVAAREFEQLLERWLYLSELNDLLQNLKDGPDNMSSDSLNFHGVYLQRRGRYDEAEAVHRKVIERMRGQGEVDGFLNQVSHYNLMLAIARSGRVDEALGFRNEHKGLITPQEVVYGDLERRLEEDRVKKTNSGG